MADVSAQALQGRSHRRQSVRRYGEEMLELRVEDRLADVDGAGPHALGAVRLSTKQAVAQHASSWASCRVKWVVKRTSDATATCVHQHTRFRRL